MYKLSGEDVRELISIKCQVIVGLLDEDINQEIIEHVSQLVREISELTNILETLNPAELGTSTDA